MCVCVSGDGFVSPRVSAYLCAPAHVDVAVTVRVYVFVMAISMYVCVYVRI